MAMLVQSQIHFYNTCYLVKQLSLLFQWCNFAGSKISTYASAQCFWAENTSLRYLCNNIDWFECPCRSSWRKQIDVPQCQAGTSTVLYLQYVGKKQLYKVLATDCSNTIDVT